MAEIEIVRVEDGLCVVRPSQPDTIQITPEDAENIRRLVALHERLFRDVIGWDTTERLKRTLFEMNSIVERLPSNVRSENVSENTD